MPQENITDIGILAAPIIYRPTVTLWNRLEGRPRTEDFNRALKAEVRDALWMLSKQWQTGEFQGEDAASALLAKVHIKTTSLTKYQAGQDGVSPFKDREMPLEVKVENQPISFTLGNQEISIDLRLVMGRHWLKLLIKEVLLKDLKVDFIGAYKFNEPNSDSPADAQICAHIEVWQQLAAVSKGNIDGYKLYEDIKKTTETNFFNTLLVAEPGLQQLGEKYVKWFEKLYVQPVNDANPSWKPSYLEHQFSCSAPKGAAEKVLIANEYYHGHLDWYNLDVHNNPNPLPPLPENIADSTDSVENNYTLSFIPSPATFPGMPHNRWWQLEDWKTDVGKITPKTTDINQLMLLDFGLNYANDWMVLPFTFPIGSIANVEGLMVTNTFGEKVWVEAAGRGQDENWNRWSMFHLNTRGNYDVPQDLSLLLVPAAPKVLEGKPLEEVYLLRDEVANMVWGVESMVPLATGKSKRGKETGLELRAKLETFIIKKTQQEQQENEAKISYQIVNSVPEQWIPFLPVHLANTNREIQLQRAAMPRVFDGDKSPPKKIEPRTSILREGLEQIPKATYFLHEEEVPRSGIRVHKSFQRTRWLNGKVFTWVGFRKQLGRGEGHSGLAFDQIIPK